jgi:hypothetical protein
MKNTLSTAMNVFLVLLLILLFYPSKASAQVLNQMVNSLLSNGCAGLGIFPEIFNPDSVAGLGARLAGICLVQASDGPGAAFGGSTGGGAASFQGSAVSILNTGLLRRMEELKAEEDEEGGKSQKPTSWWVFSSLRHEFAKSMEWSGILWLRSGSGS